MAVYGLLGDDDKTPKEGDSQTSIFGLSEDTVKKIGIGLLVTGVALGGYAVYSNASKKKKSGKLSGVKRRRRKSVKGGKRRATKRVTKRTVVKRINF